MVLQIETPQPANFAALRAALGQAGLSGAGLQSFGAGGDGVLISLESKQNAAQTQTAITQVESALAKAAPGAKILSTQAIGASVSAQLFTQGLEALGLSFVMILAYIWFRFEWQFAVGAVATLLLDTTKTIGFMVITRIPFDLVTIAAILTIIGYSTNDKVVVYDRVRENLRKYKSMKLRELIDQSINETLNRTLGTSGTVFWPPCPSLCSAAPPFPASRGSCFLESSLAHPHLFSLRHQSFYFSASAGCGAAAPCRVCKNSQNRLILIFFTEFFVSKEFRSLFRDAFGSDGRV